jgi:hypothetical protein
MATALDESVGGQNLSAFAQLVLLFAHAKAFPDVIANT